MTKDHNISFAGSKNTGSKNTWIDLVCIGIVAAILVVTCVSMTTRRNIRAISDNDAVGYTTAARGLAETGRLVNHIIYPSTLLQPATKSVLYMPGFYYLLAGTYKLFHFGLVQSLAVSGACFILSAVCTYLISRKFFDRMTSLLAAGFFSIHPANLYFSATAMTELPLVAAAALAFCVFLHLPCRLKILAGPFLLLLPFMFRETGAFMALPMGLVLMYEARGEGKRGWSRFTPAIGFFVLSVVLLGIVYVSPISSGRPSLVKLDIFIKESRAEHIYRDALVADEIKATAADWIRTLGTRCVANARHLYQRVIQPKYFSDMLLVPFLLAIPVGFIWGAVKRDVPALCAASLVLLTLGFVCVCYTARLDRPVRVAMFAFPLVAILEARLARAFFGMIAAGLPLAYRAWPAVIGIVAALAWVGCTCFKGFTDMRDWDIAEDRANAFVEDLRHDDGTVLVGPHLLGIPYVSRHYPVTFSFVPANRRTLELLCAKYRVTTVIFNPQDALELTVEDILAQGFRPYRRVHIVDPMHLEGRYLVFRRPDFWGEEGEWTFVKEEEYTWVPRRRRGD
jgi:hypothetical protein